MGLDGLRGREQGHECQEGGHRPQSSAEFVTAVWEPHRHVRREELDHRRAGAPRLLSGPGATIWRAIDGLTSTSEIVAQLGASFGGVSSQIAHDVAAFVDELYGHGYLIPAASGARRS